MVFQEKVMALSVYVKKPERAQMNDGDSVQTFVRGKPNLNPVNAKK